MEYKTHVLFGIALGLILDSYTQLEIPLFFFLIILGSLLPDIDHPRSKMGRWFKPIGWLFEHRGFFHSIFIVALFMVLLLKFGLGGMILPFAAGYMGHLLLDSATKQGIMPLHPISRIRIRGAFKTGGIVEQSLSVLLGLYVVLMVFL